MFIILLETGQHNVNIVLTVTNDTLKACSNFTSWQKQVVYKRYVYIYSSREYKMPILAQLHALGCSHINLKVN